MSTLVTDFCLLNSALKSSTCFYISDGAWNKSVINWWFEIVTSLSILSLPFVLLALELFREAWESLRALRSFIFDFENWPVWFCDVFELFSDWEREFIVYNVFKLLNYHSFHQFVWNLCINFWQFSDSSTCGRDCELTIRCNGDLFFFARVQNL